MQNARSLWYKTKDLVQGKPIIVGDELEEIWALKGLNFEIQRGETICAHSSSKRSSRY